MSRRIGSIAIIEREAPRTCSSCGKEKECRPYGKKGADICFHCAMATPKSERETRRQMRKRLFGEPESS